MLTTCELLIVFLELLWTPRLIWGSCAQANYCNGHGLCRRNGICECFEGWGSATDTATASVIATDCSARVCPRGVAWGDLPDADGLAHHIAECSGKGRCNRANGKCLCSPGFEGPACERYGCPNKCSGHGTCMSMERYSQKEESLPLSDQLFTYQRINGTSAWDSQSIFVCLCDSTWSVGLKAGQRRESEWFGPDCSLRHCPSADNPRTVEDETDCSGFLPNSNSTTAEGRPGNLCQVDCANQGICDFSTGTCSCFPGQFGIDCSSQLQHAKASYYSEDGIYFTDAADIGRSGSSGGSSSSIGDGAGGPGTLGYYDVEHVQLGAGGS